MKRRLGSKLSNRLDQVWGRIRSAIRHSPSPDEQAILNRLGPGPRATTKPGSEGSLAIFVAPIYNYYPTLVPALIAQTHKNWQLILVHDGPNTTGLKGIVDSFGDNRISYIETANRANDWGHSCRQWALDRLPDISAAEEFVVITNADNYYVPGFVSMMLNEFEDDIVAVFCDCVHSHRGWSYFATRLEKNGIDCGCLMSRRDATQAVGWKSNEFAADWHYMGQMVETYGETAFAQLARPLFVHN